MNVETALVEIMDTVPRMNKNNKKASLQVGKASISCYAE